MKFDRDFFEKTAELSEVGLMVAAHELAARRDYDSLAVFMDFVRDNAASLPAISANEQLSFPARSTAPGSRNGFEVNAFRPRCIASSLLLPFLHIQNTSAHAVRPPKTLTAAESAHFDRVVSLAPFMKEQGVWRHAILTQIARGLNDPSIIARLHPDLYRFDAKLTSTGSNNGSTNQSVSLASEALVHGNLALATAMFERMPAERVKDSVDTMHDKVSGQNVNSQLQMLVNSLPADPSGFKALMAVFETRLSDEDADSLRSRLIEKYLASVHTLGEAVNPARMLALTGFGEPSSNFVVNFINQYGERAQRITESVVSNHLVELLPMVAHLTIKDGNLDRLNFALGTNSAIVVDSAGEIRLKKTLEFLLTKGHCLDEIESDTSALKYLAKNARPVDVAHKLHVLLSLGANPGQKDSRNRTALSHVKPADKAAWSHVEKSFMARARSMSILDEMDNESIIRARKVAP